MIYRKSLNDYRFTPSSYEITHWKKVNEDKLQLAIDIFQEEMNWNKMWSVEDAKQRLEDGWLFSVLEINDELKGWYWLDYETKEGLNLYVHKDYRGYGYGFELISYIITAAKLQQLDSVWSQVDEWNEVSQRLFLRCGFVNE
jgi:RimJ/RimL family protein N-acetyltransferase